MLNFADLVMNILRVAYRIADAVCVIFSLRSCRVYKIFKFLLQVYWHPMILFQSLRRSNQMLSMMANTRGMPRLPNVVRPAAVYKHQQHQHIQIVISLAVMLNISQINKISCKIAVLCYRSLDTEFRCNKSQKKIRQGQENLLSWHVWKRARRRREVSATSEECD